MNLTRAECCCSDTGKTCPRPKGGSSVRLTYWYRQAERFVGKVVHGGECVTASGCTPGPIDPPTLGDTVPQFGSCELSYEFTPAGPACGYTDVVYDQSWAWDMAAPLVLELPFTVSTLFFRSLRWYTPDGRLTDFSAPGGDRTDVYEASLSMPEITNSRPCYGGVPAEGTCCYTVTFPEQSDPLCRYLFSARWTNWPFYTNGPEVFRIRRVGSSPARSWDVVARTFRIKAFGGSVLWSYSLVGKTLEEVLTAANAQTAGPVTMTWNTTATPNVFSRGLSAETYFADQSPDPLTSGLIPPSTGTPANIRLFHLTSQVDLPDPQAGECSTAFNRIGWNTYCGGAVLWSDINQEFAYGRGACSRALYEEMCQGVGFAGEANYYSPSSVPCQTQLAISPPPPCGGYGNSVGWLPWNSPDWTYTGFCCDRVWTPTQVPDGDCSSSSCSPVLLSSGLTFRVGPLSESVPLDCTANDNTITLGDYGANFSDCCTEYGYECWSYALRRTNRSRIYEHRKVERIA
jgi:hypothetical protein